MRLSSGRRLGPYEILNALGAGGMGEVYRARDSRLDRDVAIKLLPENLANNEAALKRFAREAKAIAALSHPNILSIHEFDTQRGFIFIVTELLEGESLRKLIARSPLTWERTLEIAIAVSEGLSEAHSKSVIHRDLKPENIFITTSGRVKILDFGLAQTRPALSENEVTNAPTQSFQTQASSILGTLPYMSPEQARGQKVDARSDIFSLGCVIYEMLTGRGLFFRPSAADTLAAILTDYPPLISPERGIPSEFVQITFRCLEKDPAKRFQSCEDLLSALRVVSKSGVFAPDSENATLEKPATHSIAVLPFVDMSPERDQEYFCDGLAEELINAFSKIKGLNVTSRTSAFQFKGKVEDIRFIGDKLKVSTLLEGSVRKAGNKLRITAQLINVADGYHLWSEKYDREMEDIFAIQDDIARSIVSTLEIKFARAIKEPIIKRYTDNVEAYNLYLQGRYYWNKRYQVGLQKGLEFFQQAILKDPDYAPAHCGVADSYSVLGYYGFLPPRVAMKAARKAADEAMRINDSLPEAHLSLGIIHYQFDWNWQAALEEFDRAIELNPDFALVHQYYGLFLADTHCKFEEALAESKRGIELDPLSPLAHAMLGTVQYSARDYDQAIRESEKALELDPNILLAQWIGSRAYATQKQYQQALAILERASSFSNRTTFILGIWACTLGEAGKRMEAQQIIDELISRSGEEYVAPIHMAWAYSGLGETEMVIQCLEKAYEDRNGPLMYIRLIPDFDFVRSDPRFINLFQRMNLPN